MPRILVLGGGVCGLAAGLLLARDGHDVTLLERDPAPAPTSAGEAWDAWERGGVPHFRQPHVIQPRARALLQSELPYVLAACLAAGAEAGDPLAHLPPTIADRRRRPGDERFVSVNVRRPVLEQAFARATAEQPRLEVRRGTVAAGLLVRGMNGSSHVTGVRTEDGQELYAELVVDAMGRGSRLPALLAGAGLVPPAAQTVRAGFVYYTRYFRGEPPVPRAPRLFAVGSFSVVTLAGDNGTWSVTLYAAAKDRPLKRLREIGPWTKVVRALPRHAHWLDGEPLTGVLPMGGVVNRLRAPAPAATGVVSVADAWACTNPTLGRGIALGLMHVVLLRDVVRRRGDDPRGLSAEYRERTRDELEHWYRACVENDRARLAEMEAERLGRPPEPPADGPAAVRAALPVAMERDPDVFRAGLEIIGCLAPVDEVLARPGLAERVLALSDAAAGDPPAEPGRQELLELVA